MTNNLYLSVVSTLLIGLASTTTCLLLGRAIVSRPPRKWGLVAFAFLLQGAAIAAASWGNSGQNVIVQLGHDLVTLDRTVSVALVISVLLGGMTAVSLLANSDGWRRGIATWLVYAAAIVGFCALTLKERISPFLVDPQASTTSGTLVQTDANPEFQVELLRELSIAPTCMTLDDRGNLYVAGYGGIAYQAGVILRIDLSNNNNPPIDVARNINRPHGLAWKGDSLYVSRSGQYTRAAHGKIVQQNTGAITRLQDLDRDGQFDFYDDIISDLPGAQLPDGLHQNNGIAFDDQGRLFVTVGAPSDHGPLTHPFAGTILKYDEQAGLTVFARGFRNPFGIAFGPGSNLFCTDNDSDTRNPGDKIISVHEDGHYGHPFTVSPSLKVNGVDPPMLRCRSAQGLAFVPQNRLSRHDDSLYVASYADNCINRIVLSSKSDLYEAELEFVARVPSAIDVVACSNGDILACSHHDRTLYRIRQLPVASRQLASK